MDPATLTSLCLLIAQGKAPDTLPPGAACPSKEPVSSAPYQALARLAGQTSSETAHDAIARVAYAEAGNQGDSGLAAVVYTILNRLKDGRWGETVDSVLNARAQFEPVMRAGGDWRRLPTVSPGGRGRIDTILNLALEGRLPDLTHGARYFQNPTTVAARARSGQVSSALLNFGGQTPVVTIGAHSFYAQGLKEPRSSGKDKETNPIFVGPNRAGQDAAGAGQGESVPAFQSTSNTPLSDPIFVRSVVITEAEAKP